MSKETKKYQTLSYIFFWLSIILNVLPLIIYSIIGFCNGEVHQKLTLGLSIIIALLLVGINILFKYHLRSPIWIVVLGIYFAIEKIMPLLLIISIGTILDEFILSPLHKKYKEKRVINKEIDKRME